MNSKTGKNTIKVESIPSNLVNNKYEVLIGNVFIPIQLKEKYGDFLKALPISNTAEENVAFLNKHLQRTSWEIYDLLNILNSQEIILFFEDYFKERKKNDIYNTQFIAKYIKEPQYKEEPEGWEITINSLPVSNILRLFISKQELKDGNYNFITKINNVPPYTMGFIINNKHSLLSKKLIKYFNILQSYNPEQKLEETFKKLGKDPDDIHPEEYTKIKNEVYQQEFNRVKKEIDKLNNNRWSTRNYIYFF